MRAESLRSDSILKMLLSVIVVALPQLAIAGGNPQPPAPPTLCNAAVGRINTVSYANGVISGVYRCTNGTTGNYSYDVNAYDANKQLVCQGNNVDLDGNGTVSPIDAFMMYRKIIASSNQLPHGVACDVDRNGTNDWNDLNVVVAASQGSGGGSSSSSSSSGGNSRPLCVDGLGQHIGMLMQGGAVIFNIQVVDVTSGLAISGATVRVYSSVGPSSSVMTNGLGNASGSFTSPVAHNVYNEVDASGFNFDYQFMTMSANGDISGTVYMRPCR